jgi:hypothetical protein
MTPSLPVTTDKLLFTAISLCVGIVTVLLLLVMNHVVVLAKACGRQ